MQFIQIEDVNNSTTIITQSSGSSSVFSSPSSTTNSSQPKNTTAAIIGVVVGGISLVGAITALFVWQRLGKRRHRFNSNITAHTSHRKQTRSRVVAPPDYNHQHISNEIVGVPDETGLFSYRPETAMLNDLTSTEQNSPSSRSSHAFLSNLFRRLDRGGTPAESRHYDVGIAQRRVDTAMVYQAEGTANENDRISRMRDQIQARVELLRWQHRDSGVEGLSNDPPPSYAP
ncbi:hypothetical protein BDQ17DRAFT_446848 [Cyathus striatus]|nr:hypothetical protein BDQ17DRAFT_446848 [Cyathus striatus]